MKLPVRRHAVTQPEDPAIKLIPLTQGQNATVDAADYEWLMRWNWCAHFNPHSKTFYALRSEYDGTGGSKTIYMHRQILGLTGKEICDHANRNTLDNRHSNLRTATPSQNGLNSRRRIPCSTGFKGVYLFRRNKWQARIHADGRYKSLGYFKDPAKAAAAYNRAAIELHGEFAILNDIA